MQIVEKEGFGLNGLFPVYQKIVNGDNKCIGYESLIRGTNTAYVISMLTSSNRINEEEILLLDGIAKQNAIKGSEFIFNNDQLLFVNSHPFSKQPIDPHTLYAKNHFDKIVIEITEHAPLTNEVLECLLEHKEKYNLKFALDDFGSGYVNFASLLTLRPDYIKVSKETTRYACHSERETSLIQNICNLCDTLNSQVIFEGIESQEQFEFLKSLKPNALFQGYFIAKPLPVSEILNNIAN